MKRIYLPFKKVELSILENRIIANGSLMSYTDTCGFFLCQRGEAKININSRTIRIKAGDVYLYLPGTYVYVQETSPDLNGITYKASINYLMPIVAESGFVKNIMSLRSDPCISLSIERQKQIEDLVAAVEARQAMLDATEDEYCRRILVYAISKLAESLIHEIIFYFISMQPAVSANTDNKDYILHKFLTNLMEGYKRDREVAHYARLQNLSPRYFSSVIKERSGKTPQQWVVQTVVNSIKQTLLYTHKSIKEITAEYNFANQSFLGKYFKEYVGMSPKDFRAHAKGIYRQDGA